MCERQNRKEGEWKKGKKREGQHLIFQSKPWALLKAATWGCTELSRDCGFHAFIRATWLRQYEENIEGLRYALRGLRQALKAVYLEGTWTRL